MPNFKLNYKIIVCPETSKFWFENKLYLHAKEDVCSVEYLFNGSKRWYLNGELHRENGPAIEFSNGSKFWYIKGNFHRIDGPAVEYYEGTKLWYLNGKLHREDGPAVKYSTGSKFWYLNGRKFSEKEFLQTVNHNKKP